MTTYLFVQFAQVEEISQVAENIEGQWGWSEMLWIALIGFVLVVTLLFGLVGIMKAFGACFTISRKTNTNSKTVTPAPQPMISDEEIAAIAAALKLYRGAIHDKESEVLTILNIKRAYSPWNSKIHGLTQLPDRK